MRALALLPLAAVAALACRASAPVSTMADLAPTTSSAPPAARGFAARSVTVDGTTYRYTVYAPVQRRGTLPVVLFLHGSGERGSDGVLPTYVGLGPAVKARDGAFPAIVVFPQVPDGAAWTGAPARAAMAALDASIAEFEGDRDRVYLTGVSMGGYGTWELALHYPGRFAAIAPVCGGIRPLAHISVTDVPAGTTDSVAWVAGRLSTMPTWIFHGGADNVVPVQGSRDLAAAMRAVGAPVRYTEYPGVGHNSWESAYTEPALWRWMFAQRLGHGQRSRTVIGEGAARTP